MTELKSLVFRFGIFEIDAQSFELRRNGTRVKLREQSFRILVLLLERAGDIVTREELRQRLWPSDTWVDFDHSLNTAIMKLRDALGDSADKPLYIETIPKRGYRFIAPVTVPPTGQKNAIPSSQDENAIATPERPTGGEGEIAALSKVLPPERAKSLSPDRVKDLPPERAKERHRYLLLGIAMAGVVVIALCVLAVVRRWQSPTPHERGQSSGAAPGMRSVALVSVPGRLRDPALSPDAKAIAYVWDGDNPERGDVYVQLIGGEKPLRLTHSSSGFICCTSWSPDGRQIAFGLCDDSGGSVMTVAALGGPPRKLTDAPCLYGEGGWPVWMADGKSLIVVGSCKPGGPRGLVLLSLTTGEKRCLTAPPAGMGDWRPTISPNQKTVAFLRMPASNASVGDIYALSLSGGEVRQLTAERHSIWGMMWAADGQHIIFSSSRGGLAGIWRVKATGGPIERETLYPELGSPSTDGRRLVYVRDMGSRPTSISQANLSAAGGRVLGVKSLISSANENDSPQLSPDGRQIVYGSGPAGFGGWGGEIWRSNADGTDPIQLTSFAGHSGTPRWSPDGKFIAFDNRNQSRSQIYVMDPDGRNQRPLTSGDYDHVVPSWSRDGRFVYFASNQTGENEVWKHELTTGQEVQVTRNGGYGPLESYDGKTLYYSQFEGAGIWSIPVNGGEEQRVTEAPHLGYWGYFAVTDAGIYLLETETASGSEKAGGPTIQFYDFQSRRLKPVLTLREDPLPWGANLTASRDGKTLLFAEYKVTSSITMVEYQQ